MNEELKNLKTEIYEIESAIAEQQFITEILMDFGEYNSENSDGVDKMTYILKILHKKQRALRLKFEDFVPKFQKNLGK